MAEVVREKKDSSIVALGEKIHKVIKCEHITKANDNISQRHERVDTL